MRSHDLSLWETKRKWLRRNKVIALASGHFRDIPAWDVYTLLTKMGFQWKEGTAPNIWYKDCCFSLHKAKKPGSKLQTSCGSILFIPHYWRIIGYWLFVLLKKERKMFFLSWVAQTAHYSSVYYSTREHRLLNHLIKKITARTDAKEISFSHPFHHVHPPQHATLSPDSHYEQQYSITVM